MATELAITHLSDLRRELGDWLRAHAGWPEAALTCACSLAAEAVGDEQGVGATIALEGPTVHLHVDHCADLDRVADTHPGHVEVAAHGGDILLRSLD
jgi:hypothetical protein